MTVPGFRYGMLVACFLGVIAPLCDAANTGELRARCTDTAVYENIPPDKAVDYINACVKRLEKGGRPPGPGGESRQQRPPPGFDEDIGS